MDKQTEDRFITLETKIAFLEDFVNQMQEAAVAQAKTVEHLQAENMRLAGKVQELTEDLEEIPNRKPPHY